MNKYVAIILASRDTNEFDRLYTMYTLEQGLVRAVAKGARKPAAKLTGHLEPGTLSEVYVARARGMGQITGAITLDGFENIKKDFAGLSEFLKIAKFFLKNFAEGEKDERVFELSKDFLGNLGNWEDRENGDDKAKVLIEAFWWKLFDALGARPEVMKCASCRKKLAEKTKKFFSAEKGGVVCAVCGPQFRETIPVSDNQIKLLRVFWGNPLVKIAKVKTEKGELEKLEKTRESFEKYVF
jgi:DNA repair protein RecO (recombination protein O)